MSMEDILHSGWQKLEQTIKSQEGSNPIKQVGDHKNSKRFGLNKMLRIAAIFIVAFGVSWLIQTKLSNNDQSALSYYEYKTPKGARSEISLPDGSRVWMNAESKLKIPGKNFQSNRKIYLEGEAYFEIKKDLKHPLVVETSDLNIKVVGTSFNVKSYPGEGTIETTLEKGKIIIENKTSGTIQNTSEFALEPNQRATFIKKQGKILLDDIKSLQPDINNRKVIQREEKIIFNEKVQTSKYTSWKDGKLIFDNETFESLAVKLERWYDIKIEIEDQALKRIRFTGTFENESIEQSLEIMKLTTPIKYSIDKNIVSISLTKSNLGRGSN
jgi:transmembrane sensor